MCLIRFDYWSDLFVSWRVRVCCSESLPPLPAQHENEIINMWVSFNPTYITRKALGLLCVASLDLVFFCLAFKDKDHFLDFLMMLKMVSDLFKCFEARTGVESTVPAIYAYILYFCCILPFKLSGYVFVSQFHLAVCSFGRHYFGCKVCQPAVQFLE